MRKILIVVFILVTFIFIANLNTLSVDEVLGFSSSEVKEIIVEPSTSCHAVASIYHVTEEEFYLEIFDIISQINVSPLSDDYELPYEQQPGHGYHMKIHFEEHEKSLLILNDQYLMVNEKKYKIRSAPDFKQIIDILKSIPDSTTHW